MEQHDLDVRNGPVSSLVRPLFDVDATVFAEVG
jgi:hypothetical protein